MENELELVRAKIKSITDANRESARKRGQEKLFDSGIQIMNQTADFMMEIAKLGDKMGIKVDQLQDAITMLGIIGGVSPSILLVADYYTLLFSERMLRGKPASEIVGLFQQQSANA